MSGLELWAVAIGIATFLAPIAVSISRLYGRVGQLEKEAMQHDVVEAQLKSNSSSLTGLSYRVDHLERDGLKLDAELTSIRTELMAIKVSLVAIETTLKNLGKN